MQILIEKVFSNLFENAVRYGGKITKISVRFMQDENTCRIICEDDGEGIKMMKN